MRGTKNKDAFKRFRDGVRARALPLTKERWEESHKCFKEAIEIDTKGSFEQALAGRKGYARAWSWMAYGVAMSYFEGWQSDAAIDVAVEYAKISVEIDEFDYENHWVAAFVYLLKNDPTKVEEHMDEALELNEEDLNMGLLNEMADVLVWLGRPDDAIKLLKRGRRTTDWNRWSMAWSYYFKAKDDPIFYDLALEEIHSTFWRPGQEEYEHDIQLLAAAIYIQKAHLPAASNETAEEAKRRSEEMTRRSKEAMGAFRTAKPNWTFEKEMRRMPFIKTDRGNSASNHWADGLNKLELK